VLARLERWWQQLPASRIKLKLGSPAGSDHDRALVQAVTEAMARRQDQHQGTLELQVDANGGWDLATAQAMVPWLADQGVVLVEQPLAALADPVADRAGFAALAGLAPLALVADESCWDLADLLRLAPVVDGINIKLLKSGGLSEALLMARCARRLGLGVMLGCYSDSSLLNSAAAQLLPLVEWPDLDSHLNLVDDPFQGAALVGDCLRPSPLPGLGVRWAPGAGAAAAQVDAAGPKVAGSKVARAKTAPAKAAPAKTAPSKTVGSKAAGGRKSPSGPSKDNSKVKAQAKGPEA
jgi:L-alanine-DL-glutamate epimerase-like enolase superfamily enzyme